jgi:hypothetical protein
VKREKIRALLSDPTFCDHITNEKPDLLEQYTKALETLDMVEIGIENAKFQVKHQLVEKYGDALVDSFHSSTLSEKLFTPKVLSLLRLLENVSSLDLEEDSLRVIVFVERRCTAKLLSSLVSLIPKFQNIYHPACLLGCGNLTVICFSSYPQEIRATGTAASHTQ